MIEPDRIRRALTAFPALATRGQINTIKDMELLCKIASHCCDELIEEVVGRIDDQTMLARVYCSSSWRRCEKLVKYLTDEDAIMYIFEHKQVGSTDYALLNENMPMWLIKRIALSKQGEACTCQKVFNKIKANPDVLMICAKESKSSIMRHTAMRCCIRNQLVIIQATMQNSNERENAVLDLLDILTARTDFQLKTTDLEYISETLFDCISSMIITATGQQEEEIARIVTSIFLGEVNDEDRFGHHVGVLAAAAKKTRDFQSIYAAIKGKDRRLRM